MLSHFGSAIKVWFSTQNRDIIPACVVMPRNALELCTAIKHISREHALRAKQPATGKGLFAVRGGAANPATEISGVKDGVVLDLSLLNEVDPSEDRSYVTIGAGAYWRDVYKKLQVHGLGVVGGRASPVGVGGSTLQGGMSFFSQKYGFICSNVISYDVVLADGSLVTASSNENSDLWRALKGGGNNFGVVLKMRFKCFPLQNIWTGSFASPGFLSSRAIKAFHEHARRGASDKPGGFDENASSPILSLSYLTGLGGLTMHFYHMTYAEPSPNNEWPEF